MHESAANIFVNALLANNFVLAMFLGLCPFLGVSGKLDTAFPMGVATTFVMLVASLCAYGLNLLLTAFQLEFLRLISYIVIIASAVQLVEMVLKKYSPALFRALGIYLPLSPPTVPCSASRCSRRRVNTTSSSRWPSASAAAPGSRSPWC